MALSDVTVEDLIWTEPLMEPYEEVLFRTWLDSYIQIDEKSVYYEIAKKRRALRRFLLDGQRNRKMILDKYAPPLVNPRGKINLRIINGEGRKQYHKKWYGLNRQRLLMKSTITNHFKGFHVGKLPGTNCPLCREIAQVETQIDALRNVAGL